MSKDEYSTSEAAKILDCTPAWIGREIRDGHLEARMVSGVWLVCAESVRNYVKRKRGPQPLTGEKLSEEVGE